MHCQVSLVNELGFCEALLSLSVLRCVAVCCSVLQCVAVCLDSEVPFENKPQLCRLLLQKRTVDVGSLLIRKRALYIFQKEPCISAKSPVFVSK